MRGSVQIFISAAKPSVCNFRGLVSAGGDLRASLVCLISQGPETWALNQAKDIPSEGWWGQEEKEDQVL